ncbi:MAG TPA: helix-turn-helix transcriptional regulator, partial [Actinomycetes bacterium]|nr:helix-turn-helix transcriptional regulator [Actinomycetes bacterium]
AADERGFRFRHALTREVVRAGTLPPERADLARRALAALEAAAGERQDLAARLAEAAGEPHRAARLLLATARRDRAAGALETAAATLDRARGLTAGDGDLATEVDEELTEVLALRGETERAEAVGEALLTRLEVAGAPAARRAPIVLGLVRAAIASGEWDAAAERAAAARRLAEEAGDERLSVRATALAAHVALDRALRAGPSGGEPSVQVDGPVAVAEEALAAAEKIGLPEVACEALEVIGRAARQRDVGAAQAAFQQALEIAERNGLTLWRVRALHELGTIDFLRAHRPERLIEAREAAVNAGALASATVMDLQIAKMLAVRFESEACLATARRCEADSRRYGLDALPHAIALEASALAQLGREEEMEERIAEAVAQSGDDPDIQSVVWGHSRVYLSLLRDDLDRTRMLLERGMEYVRRAPGAPPRPSRGLWALMHALDGDGGEEAVAEVRSSGATVNNVVAGYVGHAEAVLLGRAGRVEEAVQAMARAEADFGDLHWYRHQTRRLVAPAAIAGGWGDPLAWLREALDYFDARRHERIASACRSLLRKAGAPVPRRPQAGVAVPERLRALGVTGREMEVLTLVAEGLSNADIGERLFLSPRTVERHVSSLLARTGARGRTELASIAHAALATASGTAAPAAPATTSAPG